jgi:hypothetical protein
MLSARLPAALYGSNPAVRYERVKTEPELVNIKGAQESVPRNRFLGSLNVYEFGLNSGTQMEIGFMLSHSPDAQAMEQE